MDRNALIEKHDAELRRRLEFLSNYTVELPNGVFRPPTLKEGAKIYNNILRGVVKHLVACGFKSVTIPMSGGADSTFVACIIRDAVDHIKRTGGPDIKVIGFTLPCLLSADGEYLDDMGKWACELYCDEWTTFNIGPMHKALLDSFFDLDNITMHSGRTAQDVMNELNPNYPDKEHRVDRGNVAARLRMVFCYGIAKMLGGAQPSTDNLSEGLQGFWTLCGDEGTFKYIQALFKGLEMPVVMAAAGVPSPFFMQMETDGLGVSTNGDCSQLYGELYNGTQTYVDVDTVLIRHLAGVECPDPKYPDLPGSKHPVCRRYHATEFKREIFTLTRSDLALPEIQGLHYAK